MKFFVRLFLMAFIAVPLLSCDEQEELEIRVSATCNYDNRHVKAELERIRGTVRVANQNVSGRYIIVPEDESLSSFSPCNLPVDLQEDGKRIIFSGEIKETYENERFKSIPFKLTRIYLIN